MSAIEKLQKRLAMLESEVARLKGVVENQRHDPKPKPWWEDWFGAFANDSYFEEAMKLGQKWRKSQNAKSKKANRKK